jgi:predicted DNA binding CopG/RHH family protein
MSKTISANEFDELFDNGEDITPFLKQSSRRSLSDFALKETKKVNVDFNLRQLTDVDREAAYLGINRQACIKVLLDESLVRRKSQRMALTNS